MPGCMGDDGRRFPSMAFQAVNDTRTRSTKETNFARPSQTVPRLVNSIQYIERARDGKFAETATL
ncbi:hypothetical protein WT83_02820 [Burkholderia territorii]|uniref:Uncharacterized protein n=1 Tax=Burkholderia territorii TaxID=1503055 RepID=A0A108F6B2_9BURK|nr:hypothetical protein WT83_02820 [Burkholderia territorii]